METETEVEIESVLMLRKKRKRQKRKKPDNIPTNQKTTASHNRLGLDIKERPFRISSLLLLLLLGERVVWTSPRPLRHDLPPSISVSVPQRTDISKRILPIIPIGEQGSQLRLVLAQLFLRLNLDRPVLVLILILRGHRGGRQRGDAGGRVRLVRSWEVE